MHDAGEGLLLRAATGRAVKLGGASYPGGAGKPLDRVHCHAWQAEYMTYRAPPRSRRLPGHRQQRVPGTRSGSGCPCTCSGWTSSGCGTARRTPDLPAGTMIKHYGRNRRNHSGVLWGDRYRQNRFLPNGKFTNVTTNNNAVTPICTDRATSEYVVTPQGIPGAFLACHVEGFGGRILKTHSFRGYATLSAKEIDYQGLFPRALVRYPPMDGVAVGVEAFSSLQLDDGSDHYKDSSLPAAVFLFRMKNNSSEKKTGFGGHVLAEPGGCGRLFRRRRGP